MKLLARIICNRLWALVIVLVVTLIAGASLYMARQVKHEDDILAFLPKENPEVKLFHEINSRFGGLDLALVGIRTDDPVDPQFIKQLRKTTLALKQTHGLDHVLSLANIMDFTPDTEKGGIITDRLVNTIPKNKAEREALYRKVMSRDHVVGNLVSADGKAVLLYCFLAYGSDPKTMASKIRKVVSEAFPKNEKFWGGGPFISTYIYTTTQDDMRRLTPWAVVAIVLIMLLAFRDVIGTCLALLSTGMGIVISLGSMAVFGVRFNIVLSSMPVILFAIGSAYGIHVLARYYSLVVKDDDVEAAITRTLTGVGPTVLAAGLTTAASLLSFMWMDIKPLRTFGLFTALGILATLILSLTFIPAVARLAGLKRKQRSSLAVRRLMVHLTVFAQRRRVPVTVALGLLAAVGMFYTARVDTRMDQGTFFAKDSPPALAETFLREQFGGSQYVQLHIKGDMTDPGVLRELRAVADDIALMPHVSSVLHLGEAVARVNEILVGQQRIPDTQHQVTSLYAWLAGDPSVAQLVSRDRKQALIHVKVASNRAAILEPLIERMERRVAEKTISSFVVGKVKGPRGEAVRKRLDALMMLRVRALAHQNGVKVTPNQLERMSAALGEPASKLVTGPVVVQVARFLRSEENAVKEDLEELEQKLQPPAPVTPDPDKKPVEATRRDMAQELAAALVKLGPAPDEDRTLAAVGKVLGRSTEDDLVADLGISLATPLEEIWRTQRARQRGARLLRSAGVAVPGGGAGKRFTDSVTMAMLDGDLTTTLLPVTAGQKAAGAVNIAVNGLPVMHRGLSRSVTMNQIKSLAFALVLVVVIMAVLFRSIWSGLLVATPTLLTLLMIYGGMGVLGVHLDIGTSMLACIILGAGVDYAVHLASAWHSEKGEPLQAAAARAADRSGPAIWTNAIMVCAGFFVLTLGEARPLQNVGGLTAAAMITAAVATFLAFPALARRRRYNRNTEEVADASEVVDAVLKGSKV